MWKGGVETKIQGKVAGEGLLKVSVFYRHVARPERAGGRTASCWKGLTSKQRGGGPCCSSVLRGEGTDRASRMPEGGREGGRRATWNQTAHLIDVAVGAAAYALDELEVFLGVPAGQVAHPPPANTHGAPPLRAGSCAPLARRLRRRHPEAEGGRRGEEGG